MPLMEVNCTTQILALGIPLCKHGDVSQQSFAAGGGQL